MRADALDDTGGNMKAKVAGLAACLIALAGATAANAAFRYDELWGDVVPSIAQPEASASNPRPSVYDEMLVENGVDPASEKGQLILAWIARINGDPAVAGNVHSMSNLMLNPGARAELMADGLERMAPALRLQYVALITKVLDTVVPPDCFGLNEMDAVIDQVKLNAMTDADIDGYFRMLLAALRAAHSGGTLDTPSPQQYAQAESSLKLSLLRELDYAPGNVARYTAYSANPRGAHPVDACWAMRVTMHAILAMPDPERDVVLRQTVQSQRATLAPGH
jgi:hypothetical protein